MSSPVMHMRCTYITYIEVQSLVSDMPSLSVLLFFTDYSEFTHPVLFAVKSLKYPFRKTEIWEIYQNIYILNDTRN